MSLSRVDRSALVSLALFVLVCAPDVHAQPSIGGPPADIPVFGGTVEEVRRQGDRLVVAGDFLGASPRSDARGGASVHDGISGVRSLDTPYVHGDVSSVVSDGAGGYFIGGNFTAVGGVTRDGLAHLRADGSLDPDFAPAITRNSQPGQVSELALSGGALFVGGDFDMVNGQDRQALAALNPVTGATLTWNPGLSGIVVHVGALEVAGASLFVGGAFDSAGGSPRANAAAFDVGTGALLPWNPVVNGPVSDLLAHDGVVYMAGGFIAIGGLSRSSLGAVNQATGVPTAFAPNIGGQTTLGGAVTLAVVAGALVVGGGFTAVDFIQQRHFLAAFDIATAALLPWAPQASEPVYALAVVGDTVYAGGDFTRIGITSPVTRAGAAAFDWSAGGALLPWNPSMNGGVRSLAVAGSTVALGGRFTAPNATVRRSVAMIDLATLQLSTWEAPRVLGSALALGVTANLVLVGGDGLSVPSGIGPVDVFLIALDSTTGDQLAWPSPDNPVSVIETSVDRVYVGGFFDIVGGQMRQRVVAYDLSGTVTPFVANVPATTIASLKADATRLYITGSFASVNGIPRSGFAAVDRLTGMVDPLSLPLFPAFQAAMAVENQMLYLGGSFQSVGGMARMGLASVDLGTGMLTGWNPGVALGIQSLSVAGGRVFAGGGLVSSGGTFRREFTSIEPNGSLSGPDIMVDGRVLTTYVDDDWIVVGGAFDVAANTVTSNLAVFPAGATLVPGPPEGFNAVVMGNQVTFNWSPPSTGAPVTHYVLEAGGTPGTTFFTAPLGNVTSFTVQAPDGVYFVRLRAAGAAGLGPPSAEVQIVVPFCPVPSSPGPLASSVNGTLVTLSWQPVSGVGVSYLIEAGTAPGLSNVGTFAMGGNTSFQTGAPPGIYYVRARAVNACGASAPTNEVVVTVDGPQLPGPPRDLAPTVNGFIVTLSWQPPASGGPILGYVLEVGSSPSTPTDLLVVSIGPDTTLTTMAPSNTYYVRLRARNVVGTGTSTEQIVVAVPAAPIRRDLRLGAGSRHR